MKARIVRNMNQCFLNNAKRERWELNQKLKQVRKEVKFFEFVKDKLRKIIKGKMENLDIDISQETMDKWMEEFLSG